MSSFLDTSHRVETIISARTEGIEQISAISNAMKNLRTTQRDLNKDFLSGKVPVGRYVDASNNLSKALDLQKIKGKELRQATGLKMSDTLEPQTQTIRTLTKSLWGQTEQIDKYVKKGKGFVLVNSQITKGLQGFRMEALGVMFAGMGVANVFGSMTQGAFEMLGISDLFTNAMNIIALEGLLPMTDSIYGAIEGLYSLSVPLKQSIGEGLLFGQMGGLALQTFGSMILALTSMAMAFGEIPGVAGAAAMGVGFLINKMAPILSVIPGFGGLASAFGEIVGEGLKLGGAVKTVGAVLNLTDVIGTLSLPLIASKFPGVLKIAGTGLIVDALINLYADTTSGKEITTSEILKTALEGAVGAALLATGYGIAGKLAAKIGIGTALVLFAGFEMSKDKPTLTDEILGVVAAGLGASLIATAVGTVIPGVAMMVPEIRIGAMVYVALSFALRSETMSELVDWLNDTARELGNVIANFFGFDTTIGKAEKFRPYEPSGTAVWGPSQTDFVFRPGSAPMAFSPDDTLIGVKDPNSLYGGRSFSGDINITVNVSNSGGSFDERRLADTIGGIVRQELSNAAR